MKYWIRILSISIICSFFIIRMKYVLHMKFIKQSFSLIKRNFHQRNAIFPLKSSPAKFPKNESSFAKSYTFPIDERDQIKKCKYLPMRTREIHQREYSESRSANNKYRIRWIFRLVNDAWEKPSFPGDEESPRTHFVCVGKVPQKPSKWLENYHFENGTQKFDWVSRNIVIFNLFVGYFNGFSF